MSQEHRRGVFVVAEGCVPERSPSVLVLHVDDGTFGGDEFLDYRLRLPHD